MIGFENKWVKQIQNAFGALFLSIAVVFCFWVIFKQFGDLGYSFQFQEVSGLLRFLLYFPAIGCSLVWFYCIFKYFKPKRTYKKTQAFAKVFAKPFGREFDSAIDKQPRDLTRIFLIIGSIIAVLGIYTITFGMGVMASGNKNFSREDMKMYVEPILKKIGSNAAKYFAVNKDAKCNNLRTNPNNEWKNVFTSNLPCFQIEHKAYLNAVKQAEMLNNVTINQYGDDSLDMFGTSILYKPFEYKFDSDNNFRLRYNSENFDLELTGLSKLLVFDPVTNSFLQNNPIVFRIHHKFSSSFSFRGSVYQFSSLLDNFEYDSKTKECKFIYFTWWDNLLEDSKWVIYLVDYLLMYLIIIGLLFVCKKIHKFRNPELFEAADDSSKTKEIN